MNYKQHIHELVHVNPEQMSFEEYCYIYETINKKNGCNLLVFGLGVDSKTWMNCNEKGKTIFLENNLHWIKFMKKIIPKAEVRSVQYTNNGYNAEVLLEEYKLKGNGLSVELDSDIRNAKWDVIVVDAPAGFHLKEPCRMKSIYESYALSKNNSTDVFIHDCEREIEKIYSDYFFKDYSFVKEFNNDVNGILRHYRSEAQNVNNKH